MALLEFGHVDGGEETLAAIQQVGQRQGGFGLAHAAGTDQQEHAGRRLRVAQSGSAGAHGAVQRLHRLFLATDALAQVVGEAGDAGVVFPGQLRGGDAGPVADHLGHQARADFVADQGLRRLGFGQLGLGGGQGRAGLLIRRFNALLAQLQQATGQLALLFPAFGQLAFFLGQGLQVLLQTLQCPIVQRQAGRLVALLRRQLTLPRRLLGAQPLQRLGWGGQADAYPGAGGIQHIHRLVRQLAPGQIARGQLRRGLHGIVA